MKYLKRKIAVLLALLMTIVTIQIPRASENRDYLDITMADIIVAWYNASGVAIGYTSILNGIYSVYGNDTLRNLVNNGIIKSTATNDKEEIQQLIGYGNLTAPTVYVDMSAFRTWFNNHPITGDVKESLEAMFSSLGGDTGGIQGLATVLGMVANLGKIPYSFEPNTGSIVTSENVTNVTSLKNVYNNFVQTNYFVTLLENSESSSGDEGYLRPYTLKNQDNSIQTGYRYGMYTSENINKCVSIVCVPENVIQVMWTDTRGYYMRGYVNLTTSVKYVSNPGLEWNRNEYVIDNTQYTNNSTIVQAGELKQLYYGLTTYNICIGMSLIVPNNIRETADIIQYCRENNPWNNTSSGSEGTTEYINSTVGNLDSENYQNANPNITPNEYMYIFNRNTYETIIDTINQNTNNGQYTENGDIINNYNNTYIQDTSTPNVRPSLPPTSGELPAQPFITPRPDLPIEEVEDIIYGGNVPGEIEKKFPFCIPWDVKACVDYFWSPTRKAPHIHWNATFGEWGSLGEIDVDLTPYNTVATVHRALMLIAWIVGLAILTPKILP